ncbi:hypothetical protein YC2023_107732 [Brassica napus]
MENRRGGDDTVVTGGEAEIACEGEAAQDKHGGEGRKGQPERITNSDLEAADLDEDGVVGAAEFILYN